jgi:hypothetical protein
MKIGGLCETVDGCVISQDEIEHADKKLRIGRGATEVLGTDSGFGQKGPQKPGIPADEVKRLNRNEFSYFAGILNSLFQWKVCLSLNLWSLIWKNIMPESFKGAQASGNHLVECYELA